MNDRFESLMYHAGMTAQGCWDEMDSYQREAVEKFALLIVRECIQLCDRVDLVGADDCIDNIKEHFGVKL